MRARLATLIFFFFTLVVGLAVTNCSYNEAKKVPQDGQGGQTTSTSSTTSSGTGGDVGGHGGDTSSSGTGGHAAAGGQGGTSTGGHGGEAGSAGQGGVSPLCDPGDQETCTTSCGTTGLRGCTVNGEWSGCVPPYEICNGVDDDCNDGIDEDNVCTTNECIDNGNLCLLGSYGCSYAAEVYCIWEPDGPGGDPALVFQCLCPDENSIGTWLAPGVICEEISLCWKPIPSP